MSGLKNDYLKTSSDYIIDNNGTYTELCLNVDKIISNILNK